MISILSHFKYLSNYSKKPYLYLTLLIILLNSSFVQIRFFYPSNISAKKYWKLKDNFFINIKNVNLHIIKIIIEHIRYFLDNIMKNMRVKI